MAAEIKRNDDADTTSSFARAGQGLLYVPEQG